MPTFQKLSQGKFNPGILLLELIVIVFGISASFWVDELREKKQDTEIFNRILGEIYYSLATDDSSLSSDARTNNLALVYASDLIIREKPLPDAAKLFKQIEKIFQLEPFNVTTGSYERLVNTSLAIPVNQTQMSLDRLYGVLSQIETENHRLFARLQKLAEEHWLSLGVVPCPEPYYGTPAIPSDARLDLTGMFAPVIYSVQNEEDECLTSATNHEIALHVMASDSIEVTLLDVINIRQKLADNQRTGRVYIEMARLELIEGQPELGMPVQSIQLVGSATPGQNDPQKGWQLRRVGPVEWQGTVTLDEGYMFFTANESFTVMWARRSPWIRKGVMDKAEAASDETWFPANTAQLWGWGIAAEPGNWEVYFNSQTYEYRFEKIE